jgi:predicted acylesterase/phospholipase RssA
MLSVGDVKHLVFSGGGVRGYSYVGVLQELVRLGLDLKQLQGVGGTSIGALMAMLVAAQWTPDQMVEELLSVNANALVQLNISTLWHDFGLASSDSLRAYLNSLLLKHLPALGPNPTLRRLHAATGCKLLVIATNLNHNREVAFSHETTPDVSVADACFMSMALPGLFAPFNMDGVLYVDGGLKNNFPLNYFPAESTIGVRVVWRHAYELKSVDQVLARSAYCVLTDVEDLRWGMLSEQHRDNTVHVEVGDLSTIKLNLTSEHKQMLTGYGRLAVRSAYLRHTHSSAAQQVTSLLAAAVAQTAQRLTQM